MGKKYKYETDEGFVIDKEHDKEIREIVGYIANISNDKKQSQWETLREKESFTSQEIQLLLAYFDKHLKEIAVELSKAGDYNNNKQRVEELWAKRRTYIDAKVTLTRVHGIRATKEVESQQAYNLDHIKEVMHKEITEFDEDLEMFEEMLKGAEATTLDELDKPLDEKVVTLKSDLEAIPEPLSESPEVIEKQVEMEEKLNKGFAGGDVVLQKKKHDYNLGVSKNSPLAKKIRSKKSYEDYYCQK
jgi:hypothetical protein